MGVAVTAEHVELAGVARSFLERHDARKAARAALEGDTDLPPFWGDLVELGWLGLHVDEAFGGSGFGRLELAVVAEELGRACAPGPFLPTVAVAGALAECGGPADMINDLVRGSAIAGLALAADIALAPDGTINGSATAVIGGRVATVLALPAGEDLVLVDARAPGVDRKARTNLDATSGADDLVLTTVTPGTDRVVVGAAKAARRLLRLVAAAEAAGLAGACSDMATAYAKERVAFGRPIGQFQAVKHHCAGMFVASEAAAAAVWEAARTPTDHRGVAIDAAVSVALAAALQCAKLSIQVHGGIGYTWEHDAHLYLRRAGALLAIGGPLEQARVDVSRHGAAITAVSAGDVELPPDAEPYVASARDFVATYAALAEDERHAFIVDSGYLFPHWPPPWGRGAGPVEQLVIDRELAAVPRHDPLGTNAWILPIVLPTILVHGTDAQRERWMRPTMLGEVRWCQLFSEPGAGSDLASLTTRAERVDGGWRLTGQKVWTSDAHLADRGLALVRTGAPGSKHAGITCMLVDMSAAGITIRPLRQLTGGAEFNEVFLDDVFVADDDVVGEPDQGWAIARTSLDNERVSVGGGIWSDGPQLDELHERVRALGDEAGGKAEELGELRSLGFAVRALNRRAVQRAVAGAAAGPEGTITKLLSAEVGQRMADLGQRLLGAEGVFADDGTANLSSLFLYSRMMTIAGGTSEILRNVVAERVLGLPRDAAPNDPKVR